jgi:hypothetical protein
MKIHLTCTGKVLASVVLPQEMPSLSGAVSLEMKLAVKKGGLALGKY